MNSDIPSTATALTLFHLRNMITRSAWVEQDTPAMIQDTSYSRSVVPDTPLGVAVGLSLRKTF